MKQSLLISGRAMDVALERMDVIANNLANLSTSGYKKDIIYAASFKDMVAKRISTGETPEVPKGNIVTVDFSAGNFRFTGEQMNVAIDGDGFFKVQMADGRMGYTRRGEFSINAEKQINISGMIVQGENGPITLEDTTVSIDTNGAVRDRKGSIIDTLKVVTFDKPVPLEKLGFTTFLPKQGAVEKPSTAQIKQQYLEESNVSALGAMVEMINLMDVMRQYETQQKMVQYQDDATERLITQLTQG